MAPQALALAALVLLASAPWASAAPSASDVLFKRDPPPLDPPPVGSAPPNTSLPQPDPPPAGSPPVIPSLPPLVTASVMLAARLDGSDLPFAANSRISGTDRLRSFRLAAFDFVQTIPETTVPAFQQLDTTLTNAGIILSVVPKIPLSLITSEQLQSISSRCALLNSRNRTIWLRFAQDFNTAWLVYGQQPSKFVGLWKQLHGMLKTAGATKTFMVWSAFEGSSYPFLGYQYTAKPGTEDFRLLDTNKNGLLDTADDPYAPFWPGDEFVDWVGLSIYYRGEKFPWRDNAIPGPTAFVDILTGTKFVSKANFYGTYASGRNKSMMISETGAVHHTPVNVTSRPFPGPTELATKSAWWRQFITNADFISKYSSIRMISLHEVVWKGEGEEAGTLLDYRVLGSMVADFRTDFAQVVDRYQSAAMLDTFVTTWNPSQDSVTTENGTQPLPPPTDQDSSDSLSGWLTKRWGTFLFASILLLTAIFLLASLLISRFNRREEAAAAAASAPPLAFAGTFSSGTLPKSEEDVDDTDTIVGVRRHRRYDSDSTSDLASWPSMQSMRMPSSPDASQLPPMQSMQQTQQPWMRPVSSHSQLRQHTVSWASSRASLASTSADLESLDEQAEHPAATSNPMQLDRHQRA
ncbi:hypothetical protein BC831DRAFT_487845 [Entophlyctis helioformis]|nr:hypothetical protein BC831DRAFT_487845 [Entophlyctis helioformis]